MALAALAATAAGSLAGPFDAAGLTRAHGGQLTATSQPGHGTAMILILPRV